MINDTILGNVFNFIMDYENISFREALSKVASMAGISIDIGDIREKSNPRSEERR